MELSNCYFSFFYASRKKRSREKVFVEPDFDILKVEEFEKDGIRKEITDSSSSTVEFRIAKD